MNAFLPARLICRMTRRVARAMPCSASTTSCTGGRSVESPGTPATTDAALRPCVALKLPVDAWHQSDSGRRTRDGGGREQRRLQRGVVQPSGRGHEKPAARADRTSPLTVVLAMPSDAAIFR